ncbi:MAG: thioesterase family protein [Anaerolineales bacterium]|nr:thioesterase family protein [Anaerolineales bacterium]
MNETEKEALLQMVIEQFIPFNQMLGIRYVPGNPLLVSIENRPELVGNERRKMLHGGVIATLLDVAGGMAILKNFLDTNDVHSRADMAEKMVRVATIDLRVDYLRPGIGERFTAKAEIIRPGKRVTVTRMELHNEEDVLLALGTGTYAV